VRDRPADPGESLYRSRDAYTVTRRTLRQADGSFNDMNGAMAGTPDRLEAMTAARNYLSARHDEKLVTADEHRHELWPFPVGMERTRPRRGMERLTWNSYLCPLRLNNRTLDEN
jgi:hypothetical protein